RCSSPSVAACSTARPGALSTRAPATTLPCYAGRAAASALSRARAVPPLGFAPGGPFARRTVYPAPGDVLALSTDGVTEAFGADGEAFGSERFEALLDRGAPEGVSALPERVVREVEAFAH